MLTCDPQIFVRLSFHVVAIVHLVSVPSNDNCRPWLQCCVRTIAVDTTIRPCHDIDQWHRLFQRESWSQSAFLDDLRAAGFNRVLHFAQQHESYGSSRRILRWDILRRSWNIPHCWSCLVVACRQRRRTNKTSHCQCHADQYRQLRSDHRYPDLQSGRLTTFRRRPFGRFSLHCHQCLPHVVYLAVPSSTE